MADPYQNLHEQYEDDLAVDVCRPYSSGSTEETHEQDDRKVSFRSKISLMLLVFINLLNYMDRFTISGVLPEIKAYFKINNTQAGLLQTMFTCSYMVFAPLFGYLGDRFPRKYVMALGIMIWSVMTMAGSFMDEHHYWYFFAIRGLVGIGEASYSTVSPTIIADLFVGDKRTKALSIFYFAIPCGSGLGYIVGSKVSALMGDKWQWALRVTPGFGILCSILCIAILLEPERGAIEVKAFNDEKSTSGTGVRKASKYSDDLRYLSKVKSFVWATVGTTFVSFVSGGLAFWAPTFIAESQKKLDKSVKQDNISFIVGIITFMAGLIGVLAGAEISRRLKHIYSNAEALVCAYGILVGAPLLFFVLYIADRTIVATWVLIFIALVSLCLYWVPNADLRLAVIVPSQRSTAESIQILCQHLFGDASSPFIIGSISDAINKANGKHKDDQNALLYALYITPFLSVLGAAAYFFCSLNLQADKEKELRDVIENEDQVNGTIDNIYTEQSVEQKHFVAPYAKDDSPPKYLGENLVSHKDNHFI